jgi:Tfp pilus assembly protein PilO
MMGATKSTPWIVGAALVSVVILALGWFLAISPAMATADESRSQAEQQRVSNDQLRTQIATLTQQFTHLDEYKANLATIQIQIPQQTDLTAINTELQGLAAGAGVTLTTVSVSTTQQFAPVGVAAVAAAPSAAVAPGAAEPAPAAPTVPKGIYVIPVSLTAVGSYDKTVALLTSLQAGSTRLYLITGINAISQVAAGATGGRPAVSKGDLETTVTAYAYVLLGTPAAAASVPATPPVLPVPSGQKNPFLSVS